MAKSQTLQHIEKEKNKEDKETDFKGTFISVMLLGGFLVITWVGVWILYLIR